MEKTVAFSICHFTFFICHWHQGKALIDKHYKWKMTNGKWQMKCDGPRRCEVFFMSTSTQPPSGSAIDVGAIERELTSLWQQASEDEDHGVIRSSILNLLVFTSNTSDADMVNDMLSGITAAHPCRAVLMVRRRIGIGGETGGPGHIAMHLADRNVQAGMLRTSDDQRVRVGSERCPQRSRSAAPIGSSSLSVVARGAAHSGQSALPKS